MSTDPELVEQWQPPTESLGRVPLVTRGTSYGGPIQGDFPLDQVVIDSMYHTSHGVAKLLIVEQNYLLVLKSTAATDTAHQNGQSPQEKTPQA